MKVITSYPVYINRKPVSPKDWYASAEGEKKYASYEHWLGARSNEDSYKAFQDWMDINHPNWVNGKNLNKGSGYGVFGPSTTQAWNKYSGEFKSYINKNFVDPSLAKQQKSASTKAKVEKAKERAKAVKDSGVFGGLIDGIFGKKENTDSTQVAEASVSDTPTPDGDKKGLSTTAKIGIAIGGTALLGFLIYLGTRKKK